MELFNKTISTTVLVAILVLASAIGAVLAVGYVLTSNHVTGTPLAILSLSVNSTSPNVGDTLQLTAHVSDNVAGISLTLKNNGVAVGSPVVTDASGNAVFNIVVNSAYDFIATGTHP